MPLTKQLQLIVWLQGRCHLFNKEGTWAMQSREKQLQDTPGP